MASVQALSLPVSGPPVCTIAASNISCQPAASFRGYLNCMLDEEFSSRRTNHHTVAGNRLLLPDNLHQHSLLPASIKLPIKNLLPRAKIEFGFRYCHDDLASHQLPFDVCVAVVLTCEIVPVVAQRFVRSQPFEKCLVIVM